MQKGLERLAKISALVVLTLVVTGCTLITSILDAAIADSSTVQSHAIAPQFQPAEAVPPFAVAPPQPKPYELPTFDGYAPQVNDSIKPLVKAPTLDADAIYNNILACYPQKSKWAIDVELRASASTQDQVSDIDNATISRNYAQIVASMPLYSATELDRATKNEADLRKQTAEQVAAFITAIAERNHASRKLSLYKSLEARASVRVRSGVVGAEEQVTYLEKVVESHAAQISAESRILSSRLSLASLCNNREYARMNAYLTQLAKVKS